MATKFTRTINKEGAAHKAIVYRNGIVVAEAVGTESQMKGWAFRWIKSLRRDEANDVR